MTIALWNAIWTPLTISIDGARDLNETIGFFLINTFVDFIFWVDIIVQFRTTYIEPKSGEEIYLFSEIAYNYVWHGSFIVDFLSTFPFAAFGNWTGVDAGSMYFLFADGMSLLKV